MAKFNKGDVCIITGVPIAALSEFNGLECTITELDAELGRHVVQVNGKNPLNYGGLDFTCDERFLRKKQPPQELSSWEAIQDITKWSPETVPRETKVEA